MGGGGTTTYGNQFGLQNTTSTTTPDPNAYNYNLAALNMASNITGIPYQPYTGNLVAGFSQDQLAAMQGVRDIQGYYQPYLDQATQLAAQAYNLSSPSNFSQAAVGQYVNPLMSDIINNTPTAYSRAAVSQYYDPRIQAYLDKAQLNYSPEAVAQYYNPYQQQVIDATQASIEQQNARQMANQQAEAIRSGAFGGDRSGLARSQLAGQQSLSQNQILSGLRQQGYQQALDTFQKQQAQALAAATQQQQAANAMFGVQQQLGVNARETAYAQALGQYNQQQAQAIAAAQKAASDISNYGNQGLQAQSQELQGLMSSGAMQQAMKQQAINQDYNQWLAAQAYPYQQLQFASNVAGLTPNLGSTTNTSGYGYGQSNQTQSGGNPLSQIIGAGTSLFGTALRFSDERAKTNVDYVGEDPKTGDPLYAYDYKSDVAKAKESGEPMPPKRLGPMAQDIAERRPEDVVDLGGLLGVNLDREGRAKGGNVDPTNYFQMSKTLPFGISNPKLGDTLGEIPKFDLKSNPTPDLGFIPGLPGGPKSLSSSGGGSDTIPKLGKLAEVALTSLSTKKSEKEGAEKSDSEDKSEVKTPETPKLMDSLGLGGLFADGGRIASGSEIGTLTNPKGSPLTQNFPRTLVGQAAFNAPYNTGLSVRRAFGPNGLGRPLSSSMSEFRLPWSNVNTGSSRYNNLLLEAAKNVGPRQLTPQEFGLPAINLDNTSLATAGGTAASRGPSNYIYQITDMLTPEGTYFKVPVASYTSPEFYVNPFAKTAPVYKSHGGSVREHFEDGGRGLDLSHLGIMDTNPGDPEVPYTLNEDIYPKGSSTVSFGDLPLTAMSSGELPETNKITEVEDGRSPTVTTTAVSHPHPGKKVIAQKSIGLGAIPSHESGFDLGELLSSIFGGEEVSAKDRRHTSKDEKPFGWDDTGSLQGFDLQDLIKAMGLSTGGRAGYALEGGVEDDGEDAASSEDFLEKIKAAIAAKESGGHKDPYSVIGPRSRKGDLPYGKYQVMGANVPAWTEEAGLGRLTPEQFLSSKEAQEKVASHKLGEYYKKTGSPEKAAAMWFGGPGYASHMGARDVLGTSIPQYMSDFRKNLGLAGARNMVASAEPSATASPRAAVVASDRDEAPVEYGRASAPETASGLGGIFGLSPQQSDSLGAYLMATGAGMAASRNRSPLGAFGEGSLLGLEAMQSAEAGRQSQAMKDLQSQNLLSEIQKRNFELSELQRRAKARSELFRASPVTAAPPVSSDREGNAPAGMPETPKVPDITGKGTEPSLATAQTGNVVTADPYDAEIATVSSEEKKYRDLANRAEASDLPEDMDKFIKRADAARQRKEKLIEDKRKSLTEKVEETSPMGIYRQGQNAAMGAADNLGNLGEIEQIIKDPKVDFGVLSPYIAAAKSATKQGQNYLPVLKSILPEVDTEALGRYERLSSEGNKLVLAATNGKLGAGISNADVSFLKDTVFNPVRTREYNMDVLHKQEALQKKVLAAAEEQERYKQSHGGIDTNFQSHMSQWGIDHPVQSFMRKEAEHRAGQIGSEKPVASDRKIVKRGKSGDRPVVQYEDGTIEYAD